MALAGDLGAQLNLGYCFDKGDGVRKSTSRAMYWYRRASRRGHASAALNIGTIYRDKGDFTNARRWFLSAIKKGNFTSAIEIAKIYLTRQQTAKAKQFLTLALSHPESLSEHDAEEARDLLHRCKTRNQTRRRSGR